MPVTYSPTGADRKPKPDTSTSKAPSLWDKLSAFLRNLNDTSGVNAGTYGWQRRQPVRYTRGNTTPSSGQRAATMNPARNRFQDGDPRADRRVSYTPAGQARVNPYAPITQYQFGNDADPRVDRRPAIGRFNGYNPEGYIPMPWWYGNLNPDHGTGQVNLTGGSSGYLRNSYGGGYGGGRGGSGDYGYPAQRVSSNFVPQWIQQMVNWRVG